MSKTFPDIRSAPEHPGADETLASSERVPRARGKRRVGVQTPALLIVDDDEDNRDILATHFESLGFRTHVAAGGSEVLPLLERGCADVLLLDVVMPDVTGHEVLSEIRSNYDSSELPVILMTALDSPNDVVVGFELGANDYVAKPFELSVIAARVTAQLRIKQARTEHAQFLRSLARARGTIALAMATEEPESWAQVIVAALGDVEGVSAAAWIFEGVTHPSSSGAEHVTLPSPQQFERAQRESAAATDRGLLVALSSSDGKLLGALLLESLPDDGREVSAAGREAIIEFASDLAATLELRLEAIERDRVAASRGAAASADGLSSTRPGASHGMRICLTCNRCYPNEQTVCVEDGQRLSEPHGSLSHEITNRYALISKIGEGAMGLVFHARDRRLGRRVAIKVMRPDLLHLEQLRKRFTSEANMSARLDHPGIVNVHDYGETAEGCPFIVMEWLEGSDLAALLREQGPGSPTQVAQLLEQVAWALSYAHELKFVHRDIKPANLFISTANGELRTTLLDFGVAKHVETDSFGTRPGSMVGTPLYMAPEQLVGARTDHRSDIFSLAAVGYEALMGTRVRTNINECLSRPQGRASNRLPWSEHTPLKVRKAFAHALKWDPNRRANDARRWVESFSSDLRTMPGPSGWRLG